MFAIVGYFILSVDSEHSIDTLPIYTSETILMTEFSVVYVTFSSKDEALRVARLAIEERLAACANLIDGVTSVYRWEGAITEGAEVVVIFKTCTALVATLRSRIEVLHEYDVPCITAWPLSDVSPPYAKWVQTETNSPSITPPKKLN